MKQSPILLAALLLAGYIGIHGGKIAIFKDDSAEPVKVFPYQVDSLPAQIRTQLEKGIPFENAQDLARIAESYLP